MPGTMRHRGLCSALTSNLPLDFFSRAVRDTALAPATSFDFPVPMGDALSAPCGCTPGLKLSFSEPVGSASSQGQISDFLLSVLLDFMDGSSPVAVVREGSSGPRLSQGHTASRSLPLFPSALDAHAFFGGRLALPGAAAFSGRGAATSQGQISDLSVDSSS